MLSALMLFYGAIILKKKPNQKFRLDKEYAEWRYNWLLSLYKSYYK